MWVLKFHRLVEFPRIGPVSRKTKAFAWSAKTIVQLKNLTFLQKGSKKRERKTETQKKRAQHLSDVGPFFAVENRFFGARKKVPPCRGQKHDPRTVVEGPRDPGTQVSQELRLSLDGDPVLPLRAPSLLRNQL